MKDDNCYVVRVTVAMAPKVSGGLAAIEEEIREEEPSLTVTSLAFDPAVIDGWPIPCRIDNRWYVGGRVVAEIRGEIAEQSTDCIVLMGDKQLFAGSIDDWWYMMFEHLKSRVRQAQN